MPTGSKSERCKTNIVYVNAMLLGKGTAPLSEEEGEVIGMYVSETLENQMERFSEGRVEGRKKEGRGRKGEGEGE